ncbi:serine hydrolase [Streptomyces tanashiensis]|uniref:serine hydrolase domain-containing protein n=1 Tax=Streptomyces tanashiensis TaxID=67367 RepID=UPI001998A4C0|nr:serine hydrolase domain-containing protein [Streptomyces tanashiensis]GGS78944.1 serine hydrolase [Streptomyces tanashiensis]
MRVRPTTLRRLAVAGLAASVLTIAAGVPAATAVGPAPAPVTSTGSTFDPEPLRKLVTPLPSHHAGVLVRVDGPGRGPLWTGTAGPVTADDHFRIGSVTKVFTHTLALQLVAEHRIGIDDPVRRHLPDLIPAEYGSATVRQLLDHTSGLPKPAPTPAPGGEPGWWLKSVAPRDGVRDTFALAAQDPRWNEHRPAPGTVQQYNGINTVIVGLLVERVTGHSFRHELDRRILRPLQLRDTSLPAADDLTLPSPHTRVYVDGDDVTEQSPYPWAEGGMISTAADLDRFMTALFRGRLLPPAQQDLAFSVPKVPNAPDNKNCRAAGTACFAPGGLMRLTVNGVTVWGKTGSRPGWENGMFATRDLERRLVYSFNPNGTGDGKQYGDYITDVAAAAFEGAGELR